VKESFTSEVERSVQERDDGSVEDFESEGDGLVGGQFPASLRWQDVDLLNATIQVRHSWSREGMLTEPKMKAGRRDVPIAPGLVDMLVTLKPENASDHSFVFSTMGRTPIAYWNFRDRGFVPALAKAGLAGKGITIHGLRSAAISLYAARGLSMLETATIMGQADPGVTWKHYARPFDRSDVEARVRAAQASLGAPYEKDVRDLER